MVEDQPVVELQQLWFPTRASGERSFLMNLEFGVNQIPKGDELSVAEVAWSTGDVEEALSMLPAIAPTETRGRMKQLLQLLLGQQLTMTPQLQQAIRLLQLSTLDLRQEIQEALESNLMLETEEEGVDRASGLLERVDWVRCHARDMRCSGQYCWITGWTSEEEPAAMNEAIAPVSQMPSWRIWPSTASR